MNNQQLTGCQQLQDNCHSAQSDKQDQRDSQRQYVYQQGLPRDDCQQGPSRDAYYQGSRSEEGYYQQDMSYDKQEQLAPPSHQENGLRLLRTACKERLPRPLLLRCSRQLTALSGYGRQELSQ